MSSDSALPEIVGFEIMERWSYRTTQINGSLIIPITEEVENQNNVGKGSCSSTAIATLVRMLHKKIRAEANFSDRDVPPLDAQELFTKMGNKIGPALNAVMHEGLKEKQTNWNQVDLDRETYRISGWRKLHRSKTDEIKHALKNNGPLLVQYKMKADFPMGGSTFPFYRGIGAQIYREKVPDDERIGRLASRQLPDRCAPLAKEHIVQLCKTRGLAKHASCITGYGKALLKTKSSEGNEIIEEIVDFWEILNTWGKDFQDDGYCYISFNAVELAYILEVKVEPTRIGLACFDEIYPELLAD